ncbi:NUDIX hydrolase [Actinoplanes hulinensis]|uniref:NUDIX hydrolase n=1 Tax=Actinoplanes hulinensis TaxID=1144547 RepID=UPI0027E2D4E4|nr:NUDIX hydrolase [Actinoplanes hulinensis]
MHGERSIYEDRWVTLSRVDIEPPGVERFEHHVVRLNSAAIAAVVDSRDRVLMLRRYRFVPDKWAWELPGGLLDPGEDAAGTAAREVEEETGWRPHALRRVLTYQPIIGMVDSPHVIFVGRGADLVTEPEGGEESGEVAWIPLEAVRDLIAKGEILSSGTLLALLHILAFGIEPEQP